MYGTTPKCSLKMISKLFQSFQHMKILTTEGKERHHLFTQIIEHTLMHFFLNQHASCQNADAQMHVFLFSFLIVMF